MLGSLKSWNNLQKALKEPSGMSFEAHNVEHELEGRGDHNTILSPDVSCSPCGGVCKEK